MCIPSEVFDPIRHEPNSPPGHSTVANFLDQYSLACTPRQPEVWHILIIVILNKILQYFSAIITCLSQSLRKRFFIQRTCRLAYFLVTYFMAVRAFSKALRPSSVPRLSFDNSKYCWNCFTPIHCNTPFVKSKLKLQMKHINIKLIRHSSHVT